MKTEVFFNYLATIELSHTKPSWFLLIIDAIKDEFSLLKKPKRFYKQYNSFLINLAVTR